MSANITMIGKDGVVLEPMSKDSPRVQSFLQKVEKESGIRFMMFKTAKDPSTKRELYDILMNHEDFFGRSEEELAILNEYAGFDHSTLM